MPTTQLHAPTNVRSTLSADKTKVTVAWDSDNADGTRYEVSFLAKDTLEVFTPPNSTVTAKTLDVVPQSGTSPTAEDLAKNYIARVIAKGDGTTTSDSTPGLQIYWDVGLSLIVVVGGHSFTLTKPSGSAGGIYRLPVSRDDPAMITLDDVKAFAGAVGMSPSDVPTHWPNGDLITGSLKVYKLAVDTTRKLFALDIAFSLQFTPFTGLTIEEVGLTVVRTDGVHSL